MVKEDEESAERLTTQVAKKATSDDVFKEIGEFGKYQLLIFCLVGLCATLSSIATYQASFSEATPQFRCKIPGLENDTFEIASPEHKALVDLYIPRDVSSNSYKGCLLRLNASEVECNSWVYSKEFYERTIISEWDLVCSNIGDKGHFRSLHFMGAFAVIFIGLLSDRFGRKKITFVFIGLSALSFLFRALLVNLIVDKSLGKLLFGASKFLIGFTSNIYGIATVLSLELVGPSYRLLANNFMNYFYILGEFVVLLVSYFNRDHRVFSIYMTVLVASLLTYFWWIPESVRFLIGRKKYDRADAVFRRIAKSNKKEYSFSAIDFQSEEKKDENQPKYGFRDFFTNWKIVGRIAISLLQWFTCSFVYYGISLNTDLLGGDPYLNFLYASAVEVAANVVSQLTLNRFGRKIPYLVNFLMVSVSLLGIGFVPQSMSWLIVVLFLIGKFSISFNFITIYIITSESYPTVIRNTALSFSSIAGRIASTISPYVALLSVFWEPLPFVLYGLLGAVAGITYFLFMPETVNVGLPEKLSDLVKTADASVEMINLEEKKPSSV